MPHIASTLTCDNEYVQWNRHGDGTVTKGESVLIRGGFGLANKNFVTPQGAILTEITDQELEFLEKDFHFNKHREGGFLKVIRSGSKDGEKAASDMTLGDKSQPRTPSDFSDKKEDQPEILSVNTGTHR